MLAEFAHEAVAGQSSITNVDVVIIGAGLSGLTCATALQQSGLNVMVIEADERAGGRIKTDLVNGYRLDHGFQVYNTGYLDANRVFDLKALQLQEFYSGAIIRYKGAFHKTGDPQRDAGMWLYGLYSKIGNFQDKLLTLKLKKFCQRLSEGQIFNFPEQSTYDFLRHYGFTQEYISQFFTPFYGGVLLEKNLSTSVRKFLFTFQTFARGSACVPAEGMEALPQQLVERLSLGSLQLGSAVIHISSFDVANPFDPRVVTLTNGTRIAARYVVLATPIKETFRLLGETPPVLNNGTVTLYYGFEGKPPLAVRGKTLMLNGEGAGMMLHLCFMSEIAPHYAPQGSSLLSITLNEDALALNTQEADNQARMELKEWFGPVVERWISLGHYPIRHAIPAETSYYGPSSSSIQERYNTLCQVHGVFLASDACTTASINGAIQAGLFSAQQVLAMGQ
jgi:phytoene dehydrogenase-like protein